MSTSLGGENTGGAGEATQSGYHAAKTDAELLTIHNKLRGDVKYDSKSERKRLKRRYKIVVINDTIKEALKGYSAFVFIHPVEEELLLEGGEDTFGSFAPIIPAEHRDAFFVEAVCDKALVPIDNDNLVKETFAKNVAKHYKMTRISVVAYLDEHTHITVLLSQSVEEFNSDEDGERTTLYDFGADMNLYAPKAVEEEGRKQAAITASTTANVRVQVVTNLLDNVVRDEVNQVLHTAFLFALEGLDPEKEGKDVVSHLYKAVGGSNDSLFAILDAEGSLFLGDDAKAGTLLEFMAMCLGLGSNDDARALIGVWVNDLDVVESNAANLDRARLGRAFITSVYRMMLYAVDDGVYTEDVIAFVQLANRAIVDYHVGLALASAPQA